VLFGRKKEKVNTQYEPIEYTQATKKEEGFTTHDKVSFYLSGLNN